jgi:hypothetical protein
MNSAEYSNRCSRVFVSCLLASIMILGPLAPLTLASTASKVRRVPLHKGPSTNANATAAPLTPFAVNITATKVDSFPDPNGDGKADPGEVITYNVTISNTGSTDATGVQFNDTIDPNTTLVPGSVQTQPMAAPDSYSVLGNVRIQPNAANGLLANDIDPDTGNNSGLTASAPATSTNGGSVSVNADGSFSYNPPAGFEGSDTFTYTITDTTGKTDTALVTLTVTGMIWFINAAAGAGGDGRLTTPLNCLTGTTCFSAVNNGVGNNPAANDNIFLYSGAYTGGLTLLNNQKLIGQGASGTLEGDAVVTLPPNSDALPVMGNNPALVTIATAAAATNGINIGGGNSNTLRGFTVGNTTGFKIASGANFGTVTVSEVVLNGSGGALSLSSGTLAATFGSVTSTSSVAQGILLSSVAGSLTIGGTTISGNTTQCIHVTGSTATINFGNTSCTGGTVGVSLQNNSAGTRTFGALSVSGNSAEGFLHAGGGGAVSVTGATTITNPGGTGIDIADVASNAGNITFSGVTVNKGATAGTGVNIHGSNTGRTITFGALSITTSAGTALAAPLVGSTNGTISTSVGTISATGGSAILANGVAFAAGSTLTSATATGGTLPGISLTNTIGGGMTVGGGTLTGSASAATFFVSGGSVTFTYNGAVTQNAANRAVDVQSTTGGAISLGGTVTGGSASTGVNLNADNGNVTFTTLNLGTSISRIGSQAVTINGGTGTYGLGTVSIFTNNQPGIVATNADGTINSTTGMVDAGNNSAVNIDGPAGLTTLGMTLTRVDSSGGSNNGLSIQDTNGTFTVAGTGGTCVSANTTGCSGGTIANKTGGDASTTQGVGVFLNNSTGVSLTRVFLHDFQNFAILGNATSGFTLDNSVVNGANGTNTAPQTISGFAVSLDGEASIAFSNLLGSDAITNTFVSGGVNDNITVMNNSGTLNFLNMAGNTIRDDNATSGNDGLHVEALASATMTVKVGSVGNGNTFAANRGDHIDFITQNTTATGTIVFIGNTLTGGHPNALGQGITIQGIGTTNYNVSNNTVTGSIGVAINATMLTGGSQTFSGTIANNAVGTAGVLNSGSAQGNDIVVELNGDGTYNSTVSGNTLRQNGNGAMLLVQKRNSNTGGTLNTTVTGNTFTEPGQFALNGILVNSGTAASNAGTTCSDIGGAGALANNLVGSGANGATDFRVRQRFNTTVRLPGYGGANTDDAAVVAFIQARNNGAETGSATHDITTGGGGFIGGGPCTAGVAPTLPDTLPPDDTIIGAGGISTQTADAAPSQQTSQDSVSKRSAEVVQTSDNALAANKSLELNKAKRDGGSVLRYSAKDTFVPLVGQPVTAKQGKRARGVVSIPRTQDPDGSVDTVSVNIGTLRAGDSVTIMFQVTVNNPYLGGPNVSNQGTVSGSNFSSVLTDDPAFPGATDPTLTPIAANPDINVNDAKAPEPASGSAPMVFTVALSAPASASGVTVHYSTADQAPGPGHAEAGLDYTAVPDSILTFASGEQVKTVAVSILSDALVEPDETFLLNLSNATGGTIVDGQAIGTITQNVPGTFLISELRTSGPGGPGDDFVELYNNTDSPLTITASDASAGYGVFKTGTDCNATPVLIATIPNGTIIPARSHYLLVGPTYSLGGYAAGNQTVADIASDSNVAVFSTANVLNLSSANRLDAVGFGSNNVAVCALMQEGTNLQAIGPSALQHSFFRDPCGKGGNPATFGACPSDGKPVDLNNNATDFIFADTAATNTIAGQHLGAPGPENLASPIERNSTIVAVLLDATKAAAAAPNRVRDLTPVTNGANGTLSIRRRFVNNTGASITRLRFRIVDMSSMPVPGGIADLRALTSGLVVVSGIMDSATCTATGTPATPPCQVNVQGTTLETPPAQSLGGSLNSSLAAGTVTLGTPLANGASINLQFLLGVQGSGNFKFFINVEALP